MRVSWSPLGKEILPSSFDYEFDCILTSWREYLMKAYKMGIKSIVIHVDEFTDKDYEDLFKFVHAYEFRLGVTVSNELSIDVLLNAIRKIKEAGEHISQSKVFIQVPGQRNINDDKHSFDDRVLHRVRILKKLFPDYSLQVSGRINPFNAGLVKESGADRLVVTSYIFGHENLKEAINILEQVVAQEPLPIVKKKEETKNPVPKVVTVPPSIPKNELDQNYEASENKIVYELGDGTLLEG
jgi:pentose-5-phosphate-3-epimerase